jgi:flavin reductase (DIM6/NTAB) family NADH-FMN oxidoreductase RutF
MRVLSPASVGNEEAAVTVHQHTIVQADIRRPALTEAMRLMAGPVCVVTAGRGDDRTGATVTTAHSLSIEPEVMVVSINLGSSTYTAITRYNHYCVNILAAEQQAIADRFAGKGGLKGLARYEGASWYPTATGALALEGALASIDCDVEDILIRHSHALILGRVQAVAIGGQQASLVYRSGRYGSHGGQ